MACCSYALLACGDGCCWVEGGSWVTGVSLSGMSQRLLSGSRWPRISSRPVGSLTVTWCRRNVTSRSLSQSWQTEINGIRIFLNLWQWRAFLGSWERGSSSVATACILVPFGHPTLMPFVVSWRLVPGQSVSTKLCVAPESRAPSLTWRSIWLAIRMLAVCFLAMVLFAVGEKETRRFGRLGAGLHGGVEPGWDGVHEEESCSWSFFVLVLLLRFFLFLLFLL